LAAEVGKALSIFGFYTKSDAMLGALLFIY
jgi:hypothetical protein